MKRVAVAAIPNAYAAYRSEPAAEFTAGTARQIDAVEMSAKVAIVSMFTLFAMRIASDVAATGRLTGVLLLGSEALVVILTVVRRMAGSVDRTWQSRVLTTISMIGPPLVAPAALAPWLPGFATVALSAVGLSIVIAGKMSLGRSFGLLPANRGIVSRGCYRMLRHPIYLGYLLTHVGFVAANPTTWNIVLLTVADAALLWRATYEERTLAMDPEYREYMTRVRWRVVPGVF